MQLSHHIEDEVFVLTVSGNLTGEEANTFRKHLSFAPNFKGVRGVLIDFKDAGFISSLGIGMLSQACKEMKARGTRFAIYNLSRQHKAVFTMCALDAVLDICESKDEAKAAVLK